MADITSDTLSVTLDVAKSDHRALAYFGEELNAKVQVRGGQKDLEPFVDTLRQYAHAREVETKAETQKLWQGGYTKSITQASESGADEPAQKDIHEVMDENVIKKVDALPEGKRDVTLAIDFHENGKFVRGYLVDGENITQENALYKPAMDAILHDWLVYHNMSCKGQVIFSTDDMNIMKRDAEGNPVPADLNTIKAKLQDEEDGLKAFTESRGQGKLALAELNVKTPEISAPEVTPVQEEAPPPKPTDEDVAPEDEAGPSPE